MKLNIESSPEAYYLAGGAFMAFVMAVLRANRFSRKRFAMRLAEGLMCSMLTTAITIAVNSYFDLPYIWSIPIGTLIGFIGTDAIHLLIVGILDFHMLRYTGSHVDLEEKTAKAQAMERELEREIAARSHPVSQADTSKSANSQKES